MVSTLGTKRMGMTREELITEGHIINNGQLSKVLDDLENCGFIRKYNYQGIKRSKAIFQLIDNFTLFYYKFMHENEGTDEAFWSVNANTPIRNTWEGLAFERVCFCAANAYDDRRSGVIVPDMDFSGSRYIFPKNQAAQNDCDMGYARGL